jgi:hypothetical protein
MVRALMACYVLESSECGSSGQIFIRGYAIVPDGRHTTVAALVEFTGIFLPTSINRGVK